MPRTNKNKGKGGDKSQSHRSPLPESSRQTPPINVQLSTPGPTPSKGTKQISDDKLSDAEISSRGGVEEEEKREEPLTEGNKVLITLTVRRMVAAEDEKERVETERQRLQAEVIRLKELLEAEKSNGKEAWEMRTKTLRMSKEITGLNEENEKWKALVEKAGRETAEMKKEMVRAEEETKGRLRNYRFEVEEGKEKYRKLNEYANGLHEVFNKRWEEEFDKQVEIKMREERGKLEAEFKNRQKKEKGAEEKKQEAGKKKTDGVDTEMKDVSPVSKKQGKRRDAAPVTTPSTKKQIPLRTRNTPTERSPPVKNRKTTHPTGDQYASMKAFVVHGVPCRRPINDTLQDLRRAGMKGIRGARWLVGENRRMNKTTSSVVVFLEEEIAFVVSKKGLRMRLRGRNLPVDRYDFDRGRMKKGIEEEGSWA